MKMFINEEFSYDYYFGYVLYFKKWSKFYQSFCDLSRVERQMEVLNIESPEFFKIIEEFNGEETCNGTNIKWSHYVKFNSEEDCKRCIEYLNEILVMNKLLK